MSKDICLIAKNYYPSKRGSYVAGKRFCEENNIDFLCDTDISSLGELNEKYNKVIFRYQNMFDYSFKYTIKEYKKMKHITFTHNPLFAYTLNSATNGFNDFISHKIHKMFIPWITDFSVPKKEFENPVLGFYVRETTCKNNVMLIRDMLKKLKYPIDVYTMGDKDYTKLFEKDKNIKSFKYTNDNIEFFSSITHYIHPMTSDFYDTFPNTLLEAIQTNKQIILPKDKNRILKDGIDDMCEFIEYHNNLSDIFSDKIFDNSNCFLKKDNFKNFYIKILSGNFEFPKADYSSYKYFHDWCDKNL